MKLPSPYLWEKRVRGIVRTRQGQVYELYALQPVIYKTPERYVVGDILELRDLGHSIGTTRYPDEVKEFIPSSYTLLGDWMTLPRPELLDLLTRTKVL